MAGLPFPSIETGDVEAAVSPDLGTRQASGAESSLGFANLRKTALGHIDPQVHSRHAVYGTSKVRGRILAVTGTSGL